jgi:ribosomal protein S19
LARSSWKFHYVNNSIWRIILKRKLKNFKRIKKIIFSRSSVISEPIINSELFFYKGNTTKTLQVNKFMSLYKFGEFLFTRKPFYFPIKELKKKKIF